MVEHILHTDGVAGSNPAARTISLEGHSWTPVGNQVDVQAVGFVEFGDAQPAEVPLGGGQFKELSAAQPKEPGRIGFHQS